MKKVSGTTALCVVMLAFGIAAATTTFSAVYAAVLRPIPFAEPARLLLLQHTRQNARTGTVGLRWSIPASDVVRRNARAYEAIGTFSRASVGISPSTGLRAGGAGDAEQVDGEIVTAGYFEALRVAPAIGQGFTPADDTADGRSSCSPTGCGAAGSAPIRPSWGRRFTSTASRCRSPASCRPASTASADAPRSGFQQAWRLSSPTATT